MKRESPGWWFWMAVGTGAVLPLATGIVVWVVLQVQGKPVLSAAYILESWLTWLIMAAALAVSAMPTGILIHVLVKEKSGVWVRGAAWGMLLGLAATMMAVFGSLWRNAHAAMEVVILAPVYLGVLHTLGALAGGVVGALAARVAHAKRRPPGSSAPLT